MLHFIQRYLPKYPQTVHIKRGGSLGGGAPAVRYVGIELGYEAIP
jgi:hypothetical protein